MNGVNNFIPETMVSVTSCKNQCIANCNEFINKSMFNDYLWLIYAGLFILTLYYIIHDADFFKNYIIKNGYNYEKVIEHIDWLLFAGIGLITAFVIKFLFFTNSLDIPII